MTPTSRTGCENVSVDLLFLPREPGLGAADPLPWGVDAVPVGFACPVEAETVVACGLQRLWCPGTTGSGPSAVEPNPGPLIERFLNVFVLIGVELTDFTERSLHRLRVNSALR